MTLQQPGTTRVGGGASARLAAIVAALSLAAVAGVAIIGRPAAAPTASPSPLAAVAATPPASPTPTVRATAATSLKPGRATALPSPPQGRPRPGSFTDLAVVVSLGRLSQVTFLQEDHDGALHATSRLSTTRPAPAGTLGLVELREGGEVLEWRDIASFRLPLDPQVPKSPRSALVLERHVAAHSELEDAPLLVRSGYSLRVHAEGRRTGIVLHITIEPGAPDGTGRRRQPIRQLGDDGIIGHPGSAGPMEPIR